VASRYGVPKAANFFRPNLVSLLVERALIVYLGLSKEKTQLKGIFLKTFCGVYPSPFFLLTVYGLYPPL